MEELSAVVLLQRILNDAVHRKATDIHMHVVHEDLTVQFRIGGALRSYLKVAGLGKSIVRRVKALARMDVHEARYPQDGSFTWEDDSTGADIRVASLPTVSGEALVLRILPQQREPVTFTSLGMTEMQAQAVVRTLQQESGLVLVAGSTGSGKTTTLYAMMLQLSRWGRHVVSIEDPVEVPLPDCQQVEVRERAGVTFDIGLRALLRHDPDAIMIGEIRDDETAKVAVRAGMSGHLVLSTTHARDFMGSIVRLADFGLSRSVLAEVLRAVVVQRLVPLHHDCACNGLGCSACASAVGAEMDRTALFEVYEITPPLQDKLASECSWTELRGLLKRQLAEGLADACP